MRLSNASTTAVVLALAAALALTIAALSSPAALAQAQPLACPISPSSAAGKSFQGQTLSLANFSRMDLTNANFQGATLKGVAFIGANLTGANFSGATIVDSGNVAQATDFSFANLERACFIGVKFNAPTYLTYATLTCADFSRTDISKGNAIFGDEPLRYTPPVGSAPAPPPIEPVKSCRTAFRQTTMNCEFINDWRAFDLSGALIGACGALLSNRDFSHAVLADTNLAGVVLDGTNFASADLSRAVLDGASLQCLNSGSTGSKQCVDMSHAKLQGARLDGANLTGASLYSAFLSDNINDNISNAASLQKAHLKNVNLSQAQLSGVDFTFANFYGSTPANGASRCATTELNDAGFTVGCASAHGATVSGTTFESAYLYGVDFTTAAILGANFHQAVLIGANFAAAKIDSFSGARTKFAGAHLQGTNLDQVDGTLNADLTDAFIDFRAGGNIISILLNGINHNSFACSNPSTCKPARGQDVCVSVRYSKTTTLPLRNTNIVCPDGIPDGAPGNNASCGDPDRSNLRWKSSLRIDVPANPGPPPAWYANDATYTPKTSDDAVICGGTKNARLPNW
jgi:uncharacterized protein YjbI with pentapeptide repeats